MLVKSTILFYLTLCVSAFPLTDLSDATAACTTPSTLADILTAGKTCNADFAKLKTAIDNFKGIGDAGPVQNAGTQLQNDMTIVKEKLDCIPNKPLDPDGSSQVTALATTIAVTANSTLDSVKTAYARLKAIPLFGSIIIKQVATAMEGLNDQVTAYNASLCADLQPEDVKKAVSVMNFLLAKYAEILKLYKS